MRPSLLSALALSLFTGCGQTDYPVERQMIESPSSGPSHTGSGGPSQPSLSGAMPPAGAGPAATVDLDFEVPKGWVQRQPRVNIILAEFGLPKAEGDENEGRLTVSTAGGTVEENLDRWRKQFEGLEENPSETIEIEGRQILMVDMAGTYNDQRGPFAPAVKQPGYRMFAAIVPLPGAENLFVKAYGPAKTVGAQKEAFKTFVRSLAK